MTGIIMFVIVFVIGSFVYDLLSLGLRYARTSILRRLEARRRRDRLKRAVRVGVKKDKWFSKL